MSATPETRYSLADLRKAAPGRSRRVPRHPAPVLEAWYRQLHQQIRGEGRPVSGRAGRYVYYWAYGRLCWRVYVMPKDPHTAAQRRCRAAFGVASKAWSDSRRLTPERREAWRAAAAKTKSAPRLGQSGRLHPQQAFVKQNSRKERWGQPLQWEPTEEGRQKKEGRSQKPQSPAPVQQPQRATPSRLTHHVSLSPSQLPLPQPLTRPSSDRLPTACLPLPYHCRWGAPTPGRLGDSGLPRRMPTLPQIHRRARFRELWRGG